jgi:hypothetical protein
MNEHVRAIPVGVCKLRPSKSCLQAQLKKGPQLTLKSGGKLIVASIFLLTPFVSQTKAIVPSFRWSSCPICVCQHRRCFRCSHHDDTASAPRSSSAAASPHAVTSPRQASLACKRVQVVDSSRRPPHPLCYCRPPNLSHHLLRSPPFPSRVPTPAALLASSSAHHEHPCKSSLFTDCCSSAAHICSQTLSI